MTNKHIFWRLLLLATTIAMLLTQSAMACNEQVCASIVSKCMLTASCKCDLKACSCCKECFNCLGSQYTECCSCVGMSGQRCATLKNKKNINNLFSIFRHVPQTKRIKHGPIEKVPRRRFRFRSRTLCRTNGRLRRH